MQTGSATSGNIAMDQVSRAAQAMNQLNQQIVDTSQEFGEKMLRINTEAKVSAQNPAAEHVVDLLA